jgi:hypothetical protein
VSDGARGVGVVADRSVAGGRFGVSCLFVPYSFRGPVAVGDTGLYYVLCDESCPTADKPGKMAWWRGGVMGHIPILHHFVFALWRDGGWLDFVPAAGCCNIPA